MTDVHSEFFATVRIAPDAPIHGDKLVPRFGASVRMSDHLYVGMVLWSDRPLGRGEEGILRIGISGSSIAVGDVFELVAGRTVFGFGTVTKIVAENAV